MDNPKQTEPPPLAPPRGRRPYRVLAVLLAVVAALGGLEIVLRAAGAVRPADPATAARRANPEGGLYTPHPYIGYGLRPGAHKGSINSLGMRGPEIAPRGRPESVYRILCLGGSTTFGSGVNQREAYPARLQEALNQQAAGRFYEVVNCGVPGYSSAESLINFELRLVELQPDAIVVYHGVNDARLIQAEGFLPDYSHMRTVWRDPMDSSLERFLLRHSRAYEWLAERLGFGVRAVRLEQLLFVEDLGDLYAPPEVKVNRRGVQTYMRNMDHIVALARRHDIHVSLGTFATCASYTGPNSLEDYVGTVKHLNEALIRYGTEANVSVLRLGVVLSDHREWFLDVVHLNPEGLERMAREILRQARTYGLWGLPAP